MIDYSKFKKSLVRLSEQYENYKNLDDSQPEYVREALRESTIQRFETCYDCLWKVLQKHLAEGLGLPNVPNSPKPVFIRAFENNLLDAPMEQWLAYVQHRIDTSHDYDEEKALACLKVIPDFVDDAIGLYQTMTSETWE